MNNNIEIRIGHCQTTYAPPVICENGDFFVWNLGEWKPLGHFKTPKIIETKTGFTMPATPQKTISKIHASIRKVCNVDPKLNISTQNAERRDTMFLMYSELLAWLHEHTSWEINIVENFGTNGHHTNGTIDFSVYDYTISDSPIIMANCHKRSFHIDIYKPTFAEGSYSWYWTDSLPDKMRTMLHFHMANRDLNRYQLTHPMFK